MLTVPETGGSFKVPLHVDIPKDFANKKKWIDVMQKWFYQGLPQGTDFISKEGIDGKKALGAIRYQLTSWDLKHEHKTDLVAYMMSEWFQDVIIPEVKNA